METSSDRAVTCEVAAPVASADSVSILNNAGVGSFVNFGSTLIGSNMNVQNNSLGLRLSTHALLMLSDSNVSNNLSDGIFVLVGSEGYLTAMGRLEFA